MTLGTSVTWPRLGLRSQGTLGHFRDQRERFAMESHRSEASSPRTLSNGSGSSKSPAGTFGARLWATSRPLSGVHSDHPLATHWKHHVRCPPRVTWRFPPLPPCREATKGRTIKVEMVLDRPLAPCRGSGLLSHQATTKLLTTSTNQLKKTRSLTVHPGYGQAA
jgi:hypothetical protein